MAELSAGTIAKTPGDRVWLVFDFADVPELDGNTIQSEAVSADPALTIAGVAKVAPTQVGAWFAGGADGASYPVTCAVTLSDTSVVSRTGTLAVESQ